MRERERAVHTCKGRTDWTAGSAKAQGWKRAWILKEQQGEWDETQKASRRLGQVGPDSGRPGKNPSVR